MKTSYNSLLKGLCIALLFSNFINAQSYAVKPLSDFLETYKAKHAEISATLETRTDMNFDEKLAFYENEISKLKDEFKDNRKAEYLSKKSKRAKKTVCKGKRIRGITDCGTVYVKTPNEDMYTKKEWVRIEGDDLEKNANIVIEPTGVTLSMKVTGTREANAYVNAIFQYIPARVSEIVEKETLELFGQIVDK